MSELPGLLAALAAGYAVGSLPLSGLLGRLAGVDVYRDGERNPGSANVWKLAGPLAGSAALAADVLKGLLPVAVGMLVGGFGPGWAAGVGAVLGHGWPAFGRLPGGRAVATAGGALIGLGPAAAAIAVAVCLVVLAARGRVAAVVAAFATYPVAFLAIERDPLRLAAIMTLYLVTLVRYVASGRTDDGNVRAGGAARVRPN